MPLIREIGREQLGNLSTRTKEAHAVLCNRQKSTLANPSVGATLVGCGLGIWKMASPRRLERRLP